MSNWVIIVDDDVSILRITRILLKNKDMRVSAVKSGREFLNLMKTHHPDLVLMDIVMPEIDGFKTYERLREFEALEKRSPLPVIFMTNNDNDPALEKKCIDMGASGFIKKPFNRDVLMESISKCLTHKEKPPVEGEKETLAEMADFSTELVADTDLDRLSNLLEERSGDECALWLNKESFINIYRFMMRYIETYNSTAYKILITLNPDDEKSRRASINGICEEFAGFLKLNLRKSDIMMQTKANQFFLLLPELSDSNVGDVLERINTKWKEKDPEGIVSLNFDIQVVSFEKDNESRREHDNAGDRT
ncbi:MAG: response regulator [Lachnospiraceae bacterium]|nr:response regulator [Lachnospiraceae bacterium]